MQSASRALAAGYAVRKAGIDDADEIGRVHVGVWQEAYAGLMPADYLAGLDPVRFGERWQEMLAAPDDTTLVGINAAGEIVGFAGAGPSRDDEPARPLELYAINVLRVAHGSGLADLLLDAAIGDSPCSLWVAEDNGRALAFYARHGFVADGATDTHPGSGARELRLVR